MKPILFNTDMVKAIIDGKKTVTRRVAKYIKSYEVDENGYVFARIHNHSKFISFGGGTMQMFLEKFAPYQIGDILYVRETWRPISAWSGSYRGCEIEYKAGGTCEFSDVIAVPEQNRKWHPLLHMPKEAARIFLRVREVRAERLQDITDEQATSEGIRGYTKDGELYKYAVSDDWWLEFHKANKRAYSMHGSYWQDMPRTSKNAFRFLWGTTVKKQEIDHYGWVANPWVWVIEFEQISKDEANEKA